MCIRDRINGGDGSHEHPTQTLCDLFTLRSKNKGLKNMKVAISGDLKAVSYTHLDVYKRQAPFFHS